MKLMFASDLHGSLYYAEQMTACFEKEQADRLILLGDLLYHGPRNEIPKGYDTKGLAALLNRYKDRILAVRGNCDAEIDQMMLAFPMMADYLLLYADEIPFIVTHGHVFNEESMIPHTRGTVLVHGHTHLKVMDSYPDFLYLNPGSVSIPKDDEEHSYMIYENRCFTIKNLEGKVLKELSL